MTIDQLETQWSKIEGTAVDNGFRSIRISADCLPDLYLGIDSDNSRTLLLSFPEDHPLKFKGIFRKNLSIDFFAQSSHIVVRLANAEFNDLFNDLTLSLYHKIYCMELPAEYVHEFIRSFYRWSGFFTVGGSTGLSDEQVKGIFGELTLLDQLLIQSTPLDIDLVLESWKGPYDAKNDFELVDKFIEVKTKSSSGSKVRISSEFQLEPIPEKGLELCVISVRLDHTTGSSLSQLISKIRNIIWEKNADLSILLSALAQKGLNGEVLSQYEHLKYHPEKMEFYDCTLNGFPSITPSNLPLGASEISYALDLAQLTEFRTSEHEL